jgi:hypothetical protein
VEHFGGSIIEALLLLRSLMGETLANYILDSLLVTSDARSTAFAASTLANSRLGHIPGMS